MKMFNFFKKRKIEAAQLSIGEDLFITAIINSLAFKYPLFKQQLILRTFISISPNPGGSKGSFRFALDNNSWIKICNSAQENFFIKNIKMNSKQGEAIIVELFTTEGLIVGFNINNDIDNVDLETIDVSHIWEKYFINEDYSAIEAFLKGISSSELKKLNMIKNTFKIVLNNVSFYVLHDLYDGNYIVINEHGLIFKISHDPFQVNKIYDSITELLANYISWGNG